MKALLMTVILVANFSPELMAKESRIETQTCYSFLPNQDGYSKLCVNLENPESQDSNAIIEIYKNEKLVNGLFGKRFYTPYHYTCDTPFENYCHRVRSSLRISTQVLEGNGVSVDIYLREQLPTSCRSGQVSIVNRPLQYIKLYLECSRKSWEDI